MNIVKKRMNIIGLMCIPPNIEDPSPFFLRLKKLRDQLDPNLKLSMGMSSDYKTAQGWFRHYYNWL